MLTYEQASREAEALCKITDEITKDALTAYLASRQPYRLYHYGQKRSGQ